MAKPRVKPRNRGLRLTAQQQAIDELVSELGHAINNPLFAARAGVALLSSSGCTEEASEQLRAIEQDLARIAAAMCQLRARVERRFSVDLECTQLRSPQIHHQRYRTADQR
jgi:nitrogen-specific signal transduction histidine kinase